MATAPNPMSRTDLRIRHTRRWLTCALVAGLGLGTPVLAAPRATAGDQAMEAIFLSKQALDYFLKGQHAVAIDLYHKAFLLDPRAEYVYGQARAEHEIGQLDAAEKHYEAVVTTLPPGHEIHIKAAHHLDRLRRARVAPPQPGPTTEGAPAENKREPAEGLRSNDVAMARTVTPTEAAPDAWKHAAGWVSLGVGALGLGTATVLFAKARDEQTDLEKTVADRRITFKDATVRQDEVNGHLYRSEVTAGVGLAVVALGAWWLWTAPRGAQVTLVPSWEQRGVRLAWRF